VLLSLVMSQSHYLILRALSG